MVRYQFGGESELSNAPMSMSLLGKLQRDILTGKYRPGQKLTEQNLCKEYGVSRTPIREALRQLETDGLVENILNRGCFVIGFSEQDYEDLFDLRKAYEMDRLEETFEFMEFYTMRGDLDKMLVINAGFHQVIYEAAHNRMLQKTLTSYQTFLRYQGMNMVYGPDYLTTVLEEHRAIFKAFTDHDPKAGAEAMERHINRAKERRCG